LANDRRAELISADRNIIEVVSRIGLAEIYPKFWFGFHWFLRLKRLGSTVNQHAENPPAVFAIHVARRRQSGIDKYKSESADVKPKKSRLVIAVLVPVEPQAGYMRCCLFPRLHSITITQIVFPSIDKMYFGLTS
jgi:hypothetical protein